MGVVRRCLEGISWDIVFWPIKLVRNRFQERFWINKLLCVLRLWDAGISALKQFMNLVKIVQAHSGCINDFSESALRGRFRKTCLFV